MQHSDIPTVGIYFEPIFSEECDISHKDYEDLQKHIFSKIPVFSQERVQPKMPVEFPLALVPSLNTTYVFRITDFKKKERQTVVDILHYKLPFASKKLLSNEQHVYEIKIQIKQKAKQLYRVCITVQTETQVRNQKKLKRLETEQAAELLKSKKQTEKRFGALLARAKAQNTQYVLRKLESQSALQGDLRDWNASARAAS